MREFPQELYDVHLVAQVKACGWLIKQQKSGTLRQSASNRHALQLAQRDALFVFDLGYFKLTAFAQITAGQAYFLSRLNHQTTLWEAVGGRLQPLDLPRSLAHETRLLLEKPVVVGAREWVAARLIAVRMPEGIVNERRRQARSVAKQRGYTPSQAPLTLLAWNFFITTVPGTVWAPQTVCQAYSLRWQVELIFKSWKSDLHHKEQHFRRGI